MQNALVGVVIAFVLVVMLGIGAFFFVIKAEEAEMQAMAAHDAAQAQAELAVQSRESSQLTEVEQLRARLAELENEQGRKPTGGLTEERVAEIVARVLEERGIVGKPEANAELNIDDMVSQALAPGFNAGEDPGGIFAKAAAAGKLEELLNAFEKHARSNNNDAQAQADYGTALIQAIQHTNNQQEQGMLAMKADGAFDEALDINPEHWGARFTKAISYTFYPAMLGMQPKAIKQFEILIEQQGRQPVKPHHSQTYLMLGNVYAQRGDEEKAKATWERGIERHPQDKDLLERLGR